jgi:hypothetical protein
MVINCNLLIRNAMIDLFRAITKKRAFTQSLPKNEFGNSWPKFPHQIYEKKNKESKTIIVGDIHGCLNEFQQLLKECNYIQGYDDVVLVGDLVNKGPQSAEVVKFARSISALCVRGNHDEHLLTNVKKRSEGLPSPAYYDYLSQLNECVFCYCSLCQSFQTSVTT